MSLVLGIDPGDFAMCLSVAFSVGLPFSTDGLPKVYAFILAQQMFFFQKNFDTILVTVIIIIIIIFDIFLHFSTLNVFPVTWHGEILYMIFHLFSYKF